MRIERKKNASRNLLFGVLLKLYNVLLPFLMRSAMIRFLGVEYLGLSSLFTSILHVLNLAELGVGSAMVFSMYRPIAEDDSATICALMALYRRYYRIIGAVVLGAGLLLTPAIPRLIHGSVPAGLNVYTLYFLNLLATVFSYWLFAYRNSILSAYQRHDVISKIALFTNTIKYGVQLLVLALLKNYYWYVIAIISTQILNNVVTAIVSKRMYPQYAPEGKLAPSAIHAINGRVKDVFTAKLGGTILNSADTIIISSFLGLRLLAIYQNYYYVMNALVGLFTILFTAVTAGVGNSLVLESAEKNYRDFKTLSGISFCLMGFCSAGMLCLYQDFITLWVGKEFLLEFPMVVLFCVYFLVVEYVMLASVYKDAAGIWHQDRFRPLLSGVANLLMNLLMVRRFGLYGILLSTILSAGIVSVPWITHNLFHYIFPGKSKDYLLFSLRYFGTNAVVMGLSYWITSHIGRNGIPGLLLKGVICAACSGLSWLVILGRQPEFRRAVSMACGMVRSRK